SPGAQLAVFQGSREGAFSLISSFGIGGTEEQGQLLAEDLDGDRHTDLLYAGRSSLIARGPGFASLELLSLGRTANGVASIDADGDGRRDLVFAVEGQFV